MGGVGNSFRESVKNPKHQQEQAWTYEKKREREIQSKRSCTFLQRSRQDEQRDGAMALSASTQGQYFWEG